MNRSHAKQCVYQCQCAWSSGIAVAWVVSAITAQSHSTTSNVDRFEFRVVKSWDSRLQTGYRWEIWMEPAYPPYRFRTRVTDSRRESCVVLTVTLPYIPVLAVRAVLCTVYGSQHQSSHTLSVWLHLDHHHSTVDTTST